MFLRLSSDCSVLNAAIFFLFEQTTTYLNYIVFKEIGQSRIKKCIFFLLAVVLFIYLYCFVVSCWAVCLHLNTTKVVVFKALKIQLRNLTVMFLSRYHEQHTQNNPQTLLWAIACGNYSLIYWTENSSYQSSCFTLSAVWLSAVCVCSWSPPSVKEIHRHAALYDRQRAKEHRDTNVMWSLHFYPNLTPCALSLARGYTAQQNSKDKTRKHRHRLPVGHKWCFRWITFQSLHCF